MPVRNYANAPATALTNSCSALATSIVVNSVSGLPISYPFTLIIDRGTATEEAVSVTAAAGTTLTVTRGIDGTTAFAHTKDAVVVHGITAQDIREANSHVNANNGVHGATGNVVGTTDAQVLTNKDLTSGTNSFPASLVTLTGTQTLTGKTISFDSNTITALWTAYTPTWTGTTTNPVLGNGSLSGRYMRVGQTVFFQVYLLIGSTTTLGAGRWDFTLPVPATSFTTFFPFGTAVATDQGSRSYAGLVVYVGGNKVCMWRDGGATEATATPTSPHAWAATDVLVFNGSYEAT